MKPRSGSKMRWRIGAVSAGHVDALANATRRLDDDLRAEFFSHEDLLLDAATTLSVDIVRPAVPVHLPPPRSRPDRR